MLAKPVRAIYKDGHLLPLDDLQLQENTRVIISIVEEPEQSESQTPDDPEIEAREELIRKIMLNTGCARVDVENLFKTQGLWLDDSESEEMLAETEKGFERWQVEEW